MTSNTEFEYDLGVVGLGYVGLTISSRVIKTRP